MPMFMLRYVSPYELLASIHHINCIPKVMVKRKKSKNGYTNISLHALQYFCRDIIFSCLSHVYFFIRVTFHQNFEKQVSQYTNPGGAYRSTCSTRKDVMVVASPDSDNHDGEEKRSISWYAHKSIWIVRSILTHNKSRWFELKSSNNYYP